MACRIVLQIGFNGGPGAFGFGVSPGLVIQPFQVHQCLVFMNGIREVLHEFVVTKSGVGVQR